MNDGEVDLGPCCGCGGTGKGVRNIVMLDCRCAVPGHGWGCLLCGLPSDGASIVMCDLCFDGWREDRVGVGEVCRGYPAIDGREPITEARARGSFEHNRHLHALDEATYREAYLGTWDAPS